MSVDYMPLLYTKLRVAIKEGSGGQAPARQSANAAGYDLYTPFDITIVPEGASNQVPLGIHIAVPPGTYGRIAARSGLALKYGCQVLAGVIDSDYRGEVVVLLTTNTTFFLKKGERVAQLILERIETPNVIVVDNVAALGETVRGDGGFGSTGK